MELGPLGTIKSEDVFLLVTMVGVAAVTSLAVFLACFFWFRREQRRLQSRILASIDSPDEGSFIFGLPRAGELVAQFRSKQGKQVISVLEADGKRFVHIDGEITAPERARMVRYLKSEGFMS